MWLSHGQFCELSHEHSDWTAARFSQGVLGWLCKALEALW